MAIQGNSGITYVVAAVSTLSDVELTNLQPGQSLNYDGDKWINASAGNGTVTSVGVSGGNGLVVIGSPVTGSGTIDINVSGLSTSQIDGGAFGRLFFSTNTTAAAQALLNQTSGTVTSVAVSGGDGITVAGSPITNSGTITIDVSGLPATKLQAGAFGRTWLGVATTASARDQLAVGTVGGQLMNATTTAAAQGTLGAGAVGAQLFACPTTAAAQAIVGGGSGTVTSAGFLGAQGINITGSPITTQGVITVGMSAISPTSISTGVVSATTLNVTGDIQAATGRVTASAATVTNQLTAGPATFSGLVSANSGLASTTGSFSGLLTGNTASFGGIVSANAGIRGTTGSFSGIVSAAGLNSSNGITGSAASITGSISAGSLNVTGDILAATGRLTASAATINNLLTGSTANFTGRVSANSIQFSSTTGIVGTTTNDNAASGSVGQIIEAENSAGTANSLTSTSAANVLSIALSPGDWDVWGNIFFIAAGTTQGTSWNAAISTSSQTFPANSGRGGYWFASDTAIAGRNMATTGLRTSIKVATSTNTHLVALATFTVSTMTAYGYLAARRVR